MSPESLVALEQLSPRVPAQLGVVQRHSPQEAGRGGTGRGTQVEGADPGIVSLGTTFPRHRISSPASRRAPIKCSWRRVYPLEDCSRWLRGVTAP